MNTHTPDLGVPFGSKLMPARLTRLAVSSLYPLDYHRLLKAYPRFGDCIPDIALTKKSQASLMVIQNIGTGVIVIGSLNLPGGH